MKATKKQIVDLEKRFWKSIKEEDVETGQALIAEESLVAGPSGTMVIDPDRYGELARKPSFKLDEFKMTDVDVIFPSDDVAIIAYEVHETGEMNGKPMDLRAVDSTTWVREGKEWKAALHTETVMEPQR